jgi:hypothetical protein
MLHLNVYFFSQAILFVATPGLSINFLLMTEDLNKKLIKSRVKQDKDSDL